MRCPTQSSLVSGVFLLSALFISNKALSQETLTLRSGNGAINSTDSKVTYLSAVNFNAQFTPAQFSAARSGSHAIVVNPFSSWVPGLNSDQNAKWNSTDAFRSPVEALYAVDFQLSTQSVTSGSLVIDFAADDSLGVNFQTPGIYVNGFGLAGSEGIGTWTSSTVFSSNSIGPQLKTGTNTLYLYQHDIGNVAGLLFSAKISAFSTSSSVPEPGNIALLVGLGGVGLSFAIRRRVRKTKKR